MAQDSPQSTVPVFKVGTALGRVDVVVTDKKGTQVRDLTAKDFEIMADGLPAPVRVVSFVPVWVGPGEPADSADMASVRRVVAFFVSLPVASLELPWRSQTSTMVVADKARRVARMLDSFFKTQMLPTDMVAIAHADSASIRILANFGADRNALEAAGAQAGIVSLESAATPLRVVASPAPGPGARGYVEQAALAEYTSQILLSLDSLISAMEAIPGRRLLFFVGGLKLRSPATNPGWFVEVHKLAQQVIEHANRAEVTLYGIEPSGFDQGSLDGLDELTRGTGGSVIGRTELLGANLGKILARNLGYYALGYESQGEVTAAAQRIRVRVGRRGVRVTARPVAYVKEGTAVRR
jgi:VWFA-related protein